MGFMYFVKSASGRSSEKPCRSVVFLCPRANVELVKRVERKPTRCNNIDGLLSIMDVGY